MRILQVSRMSPARRAESSLAAFSLVEAICRAGHQITYAWFPDRRDWEDILAARELVEACQGNLTLLPLAGKANWLDDPRRALWAAARASAVLGPRLLHMLANRPADAIHALQRLAYLVRRFDPRPVRQLERLLSANAFDLVQFDYPWTMRLAGQLRLSAPSVFVAHEVQYETFRQMFPGDRGLHLAVRRRERRALRRYSAVLALSREDAAVLHDEMKLPRVHCSPLPLPLRPLQAPANVHRPGEAVQFSFLGGYRHHPNLDALRWLARDIVPRLRLAFPYMKLRIVGRWPQRHQRRGVHRRSGRSGRGAGPVDLPLSAAHRGRTADQDSRRRALRPAGGFHSRGRAGAGPGRRRALSAGRHCRGVCRSGRAPGAPR